MHTVHDFLVSAISLLGVLGVMVVVHELGHFVAAKLCGVRVEQFSVGFPPRLIGFKIGETDYCISAIPLGGYVKMTGETLPGENMALSSGESAPKSDPGALTSHPRWQRMIIGVAGPFANFVLAVGLMTGFYMFHNEVPLYTELPVTLDWVLPDSPAAQAGLQPGDRIVSYDGQENPNWDTVYTHSILNLSHSVSLAVDRNGQRLPLTMQLPPPPKSGDFSPDALGLLVAQQPNPVTVQEVVDNTPASAAGIQPGDQFLSMDGHTFHSLFSIIPYLQSRKGAPSTLVIKRGDKTFTTVVTPTLSNSNGSTAWRLGFNATPPPTRIEQLPLPAAFNASIKFNRESSTLILEVLKRLLSGRMALSNLSGPVGIARQTGQAWEMTKTFGWEPMIKLATTISLNLGILNLLPFPILDGGMILFLLVESIIRRDVNPAFKERVYQVAFVLIIVFFGYIMFSDISKLPIFGRH